MDPDNYGQLVVYEMPTSNLPDGPGIVASTIQADETVSELENLLGRGGSEVRYGNLLLVPIDSALLYVQPFYVVAEGEARELPLLERVIVVFGDDVVIEDTLAEALERLFPGQVAATQEEPAPDEEVPPEDGDDPESSRTTPADPDAEAGDLLNDASTLFDEAQTALEEGDLGTYQEKVNQAQDKVSRRSTCWRAARRRRRPAPSESGTRSRRPPPRPGGLRGRRHPGVSQRPPPGWRTPAGRARLIPRRNDAGWSSLVARRAHNPKVVGSNPTPATKSKRRSEPVPQGRLFCMVGTSRRRRQWRR